LLETVLITSGFRKFQMPRFTVREFAKTVGLEEVGPDYVGAGIMLKMLCKHGLAKEVDKLTSASGKGRKSMVYELSDKIVLDFGSMQTASNGFAPKVKKPKKQKEEIAPEVDVAPEVEEVTTEEVTTEEVTTEEVITQWEEEVKETEVVKQEPEVVETATVEATSEVAAATEPLTFYSYGEDDEDEEAA